MKNTTLNKILIGIIAGLILILISGTISGLSKKESRKPEVLLQQGKAVNLSKPADTEIVSYYEIGSIRILTAQEEAKKNGYVMVVNPWLAYPEGDTVFFEEIARKRGIVKGIVSSYFSAHTREDLLKITEVSVEQELLELINQQFSLGKISDIYFTDYIFLD